MLFFFGMLSAFLKIEKGCAQNSAITRLKNLKKIIRIALENDWIKKDPFAYYRFKLEETDPEFLTMFVRVGTYPTRNFATLGPL